MYIHNYQIHNVLNAYRKQLSQKTMPERVDSAEETQQKNAQPKISIEGQRQSLFDKISAQIVERLIQSGPETHAEAFGADLATDRDCSLKAGGPPSRRDTRQETTFKYTVIDRDNRKFTHALPVRPMGLPAAGIPSQGTAEQDKNRSTGLTGV